MLILGRKPGQSIQIGGGITITFFGERGGRARIGIEAPPDVNIVRTEIKDRVTEVEAEVIEEHEVVNIAKLAEFGALIGPVGKVVK